MKKWILTGILALMTAALLIGCGKDAARNVNDTDIQVSDVEDEEKSIDAAVEEGNQDTGDQETADQEFSNDDEQNVSADEAAEQTDNNSASAENNDADAGELGKFSTLDLKGHTVAQDFYQGYDLTVVNVWGTSCGPCISEMPALGRWAAELPDNVQLVGIICDVYTVEAYDAYEEFEEACAEAEMIVEDAGADYTQLVTSYDMEFMKEITCVPTTFFVDGNGRIVGDSIEGANVEAYKSFVRTYLE